MNQNLFEMYIGVTINFQKEPDRAHTDRIQGYQPHHRGIGDRGG